MSLQLFQNDLIELIPRTDQAAVYEIRRIVGDLHAEREISLGGNGGLNIGRGDVVGLHQVAQCLRDTCRNVRHGAVRFRRFAYCRLCGCIGNVLTLIRRFVRRIDHNRFIRFSN